MKHVIRFQNDGTIKAIHSDKLTNQIVRIFPNSKLKCPRASNVHFNSRLQKWRVKPKNQPTLKQVFSSREEAIRFEISWLNKHVIGK